MVGLRFSNVMEPGADYAAFPGFDADPRPRNWNLWSYIDARDGAQAVRRALDYDPLGYDAFIIAAADTVMSRTNAWLMAEFFPASRPGRAGRAPVTDLDRESQAAAGVRPAAPLARQPRLLRPLPPETKARSS